MTISPESRVFTYSSRSRFYDGNSDSEESEYSETEDTHDGDKESPLITPHSNADSGCPLEVSLPDSKSTGQKGQNKSNSSTGTSTSTSVGAVNPNYWKKNPPQSIFGVETL